MPTQQTENRRSVVPLIEGAHDDIQVIRLEGDRFIVTAQQAIDFLSIASNAVAFQAQLKDALATIADWIEERKRQIASAYVVLTSNNILFLVMQRDVELDFELEDAMVELDIELANSDQTNLIPMQTLLVPKVGDDVLQSFLSSGHVVQHQLNAESSKPRSTTVMSRFSY